LTFNTQINTLNLSLHQKGNYQPGKHLLEDPISWHCGLENQTWSYHWLETCREKQP